MFFKVFMSWENDDPSFQGSLPRSLYVTPNSVGADHDLQLPVQCEKGGGTTYFNPSVYIHYFHQKRLLLQRMHLPLWNSPTWHHKSISSSSLLARKKEPMALFFLSKHELCFYCKMNDFTDRIWLRFPRRSLWPVCRSCTWWSRPSSPHPLPIQILRLSSLDELPHDSKATVIPGGIFMANF